MAEPRARSPRIVRISWGRMEVEGLGAGKDFMLWPGGGCPWDWRTSGTSHSAGIQPPDVEKLIENGAQVIVLSRGMQLRLETSPATVDLLRRRGIPFHIQQTDEAAETYNRLAESGEAVGGLFHSTC